MLWPVQTRTIACAMNLVALVSIPVSVFSQADATFSAHSIYNSPDVLYTVGHGDFNGDGREDLVVLDYVPNRSSTTLLFLSSGDGTYDAPITLPPDAYPSDSAIGDFNHDGKLDFASVAPSGALNIYLGKGDGTFQSAPVLGGLSLPSEQVNAFAAVDLNGDNRTDIAEVIGGPSGSRLQIWISNGDGTFTLGQRITSNVLNNSFSAVPGDFDGDGKPDVALVYSNSGQAIVQVWFGDGKGHLIDPITWTDSTIEDTFNGVSYELGNGHSTLIGGRFNLSSNNGAPLRQIAMLTVNTNRTFSFSTVATTGCPGDYTMADFDGDGVDDLAYSEVSCAANGGGGNAPSAVVVKYGNSDGTYGPERTIYTNPYSAGGVDVLKSTQGTRPDVFFSYSTAAAPSSYANAPGAIGLLSNDSTTGLFPRCGTPDLVEGVNVCAPDSASAKSQVNFSVSAAGPAFLRTAAVWIDGHKVGEQLTHAFSHYSFLDASIALSAGSHAVTVYGTAIDGTLQQNTFDLTVGGGGGSCAAPTSPGVNVCSPTPGSKDNSPVTFIASGTGASGAVNHLELWIDGKKIGNYSGSTMDASVTQSAGSHTATAIEVDTEGNYLKSTPVTYTVK